MDTIIWLYALTVLTVVLIIYYIKNLAQVQVWIHKRFSPGAKLNTIGYLEMDNDGSAGEARIPGGGSLPAVGRVIVDKQAGREYGFVESVTTDILDETQNPKYKQIGFIGINPEDVVDKYGYIYRQERGKRKKELVGYCARPSDPNTPTLHGERTWHSLWLRCTLNVYAGRPANDKGEQPAPVQPKQHMYIADEVEDGVEVEETTQEPMPNEVATETVEATENAEVVATETAIAEESTADVNPTEETPSEAETTEHTEEPATEPIPTEEIPSKTETEAVVTEPVAEPTMEPTVEPVVKPVEETTSEHKAETSTKESTPEASEESKEEPTKTPEQTPEQTPEETKKSKEKSKAEKKSKKSKKKVVEKEALATVSYVGFHLSRNDYLPAEARACAFAALSSNIQRGRYSEYFKNQPYGWRDTALLTSLVFSVLFFVLFIVYRGIFQLPLLGDHFGVVTLIVFYYVLWALVRLIKIDCIENSNSFQKTLDLLNKNVGVNGMNISIIIMGIIAFAICLGSLEFDFLPLLWAIVSGVFVNMTLTGANKRWIIHTSFNEKDDEAESSEEIINPTGDISRTYEWELDKTYSTQQLHGSVTLYFTAQEIADMRQCNPFFAQRKDKRDKEYIMDMFQFLNEHKNFLARVRYIAHYINDTIKQNNLTPIDKIQFTLDFVQEPNISFVANRESRATNNYEYYIRYPDETLYDKEGDSNSKSLLAAALFHTMGYNVMYLASRKHKHSAIGIEISARDIANGWYGSHIDDMLVTENGKQYIYCETTGDRFRIGRSISGMTINDFEDKLILEVEKDNAEDDTTTHKSVIYNWDLDSPLGNTLHGNLTIKFCNDYIERLREQNPFITFGHDSNTYAQNIRTMFAKINEESELRQNLDTVAQYMKHEVENAGLTDLDLVQFVLNFVQTPNITYRIDEECASIGFKMEYMRFPDETLYDKEGDCDCKSFLTAGILHQLGYNVVFLLSDKLKHAAMAVEVNPEWMETLTDTGSNILQHNGKSYIFCESTGSGNRIGNIKEETSVQDFDTVIELPA